MAHGIPESSLGDFIRGFVFLVVVPMTILGGFVYVRYFSPCSWWSGVSITDTPNRCLDIGRKP